MPAWFRDNATAVVQAIADGIAAGSTDLLSKLKVYAAAANPQYAEDTDLDLVGRGYGVFRANGESDDAYRQRIYGESADSSPEALREAINKILAPFTATQCEYSENPNDSVFVYSMASGTTSGAYIGGNDDTDCQVICGTLLFPSPIVLGLQYEGHSQGTWRIPVVPYPGSYPGEVFADSLAAPDPDGLDYVYDIASADTLDPVSWPRDSDVSTVFAQVQSLLESSKSLGVKYWIMLDPTLPL